MYTEGLQVGDGSYILSDESGNLTLLNGKCKLEEAEEYIKLQNKYEEKLDEKSSLQDTLFMINNKEARAKSTKITMTLSLLLAEGILIILGTASLPLIDAITVFSIPVVLTLVRAFVIKPIKYGTKKKREKQKLEITSKLETVIGEIKQVEKKMKKYKEKIECESYFREDEIIPVTTVENKKTNVKMRVLKLDQSR